LSRKEESKMAVLFGDRERQYSCVIFGGNFMYSINPMIRNMLHGYLWVELRTNCCALVNRIS
jgi:hypothetical protein